MALFASVAIIGLGAALTASTTFQGRAAALSPQAAHLPAEAAMPRLGFADLVAKVKPAVISVRVKLDEGPTLSSNMEGESGLPFPPGSPMDKFFQQFGFPGMPQERSHSHTIVTGEGSFDRQSLYYGKAVAGIAEIAAKSNTAVAVIAGQVNLPETEYQSLGIRTAIPCKPESISLTEALENPRPLLRSAAQRFAKEYLTQK